MGDAPTTDPKIDITEAPATDLGATQQIPAVEQQALVDATKAVPAESAAPAVVGELPLPTTKHAEAEGTPEWLRKATHAFHTWADDKKVTLAEYREAVKRVQDVRIR